MTEETDEEWAERIARMPTIPPVGEPAPQRNGIGMKTLRYLFDGTVKALREQLAERDRRIAALAKGMDTTDRLVADLDARIEQLERKLAEADKRPPLRSVGS